MQQKDYTIELGGETLTASFTDLADQANGSVILRAGNTAVLATAVMSHHLKEGIGYFPLTVDYEERFYAAGAILGSRFIRREGRPSEEAILSGRVVDRTIRPLFNRNLRNEVQVIITVLSIDEYDPDVLAVNAASLALLTSDIPWDGPVSAVRIGKRKNSPDMLVNPSYALRRESDVVLDSIICGKDGKINMIEVGAQELAETDMPEVFETAVRELEKLQEFQKKIVSDIGKPKRALTLPQPPEGMAELFDEKVLPQFKGAIFSGAPGKTQINELKNAWLAIYAEAFPDKNVNFAIDYYEDRVDDLLHTEVNASKRRVDGRTPTDIRPLFAQAGRISPVLHGSGIFYRGATHVLSTLTLGGPGDSQLLDNMEEQETKKRFMHHYNFPPFSSGETGRMGGLNRRMVGHGALAEKALRAVMPAQDSFPYTVRLVSECLASNGSTSMASVCASTLALMDGGVPISAPVAGIAMGLLMESNERYTILTDIQGPEDHHGDMDLKVAGTERGITAIQMDVKVSGIPLSILAEALADAKTARLSILKVITNALPAPRQNISPRAPEIVVLKIKQEQIGMVIGPGGRMINSIKEDTKTDDITIEEDGSIYITGKNGTAQAAAQIIRDLTREYLPGEEFEGEVTRLMDFGAFVKIGPKAEGLVHVSEIAPFRIEKVSDVLSVGERVPVIIKEIDEKDRINLSIKKVDPDFAQKKGIRPPERPPRREP
jgi:polyribonucleotide nucleotidyltransferase